MARDDIKVDSMLVRLCIEAACESSESVERWRMQRRTLERLPSPIAEALLHRLLHRRLLYPSLLEYVSEKFSLVLSVSDSVLNSLQGLTRLEYLDLWGSFISNKGILMLRNFLKLNHLSLAWTTITMFPNLKHLKYLDMSNCTINSVLEENGANFSLAKLIFHGSSFKIATEVFSSLDSSSLTFLDVSNTTLDHFDFLHPMSALEHLDLSYSMVLDESLEEIAKVGANLRHLNLNNTQISSAGVATLVGHVPKLESISLSHTLIDDFAIVYISMMTQLQAVDLSDTSIRGIFYQTDHDEDEVLSLAELKNLSQLKKLDLSRTLITDSELSPLSSLQLLGNLSLRSANLTDNCLLHLESITSLVDLSIQDALLTDNALSLFNPPPKLRSLDLRGCWLLTGNAITLLYQKHHHHHIQIRHELLQVPSIVGPSSSMHGSSSKVASHNSGTKKKGQKTSGSPSPFKKYLMDQRIKYSKEQLLSLEHSTSVLSISANINSLIPEALID